MSSKELYKKYILEQLVDLNFDFFYFSQEDEVLINEIRLYGESINPKETI